MRKLILLQKKITIILFLTIFFSCSNNETSVKIAQPLQIDKGEEEGWGADIRLSVVEQTENDTSVMYHAISTYKGKELGLSVSFPKRKEGDKGFGQGIVLGSIGIPSDNLLQILAQLYGQPKNPNSVFVKNIRLNYVNLKEFVKSVAKMEAPETGTKDYKLFFEGKEDYAELFLIVNPKENWIELREKDQDYRPTLLKFLGDNNKPSGL